VAINVRVVLDQKAIAVMLAGEQGEIAADLTRRAIRVQSRARQYLSGPYAKVRTGRLRSSISYEILHSNRGLVARIGSNVSYAIYLHEGTRAHGPKSGRFLTWRDPDSGRQIFAKWVRGIRPRPFLSDALDAAR
jgi:hypothetical protein